MSEIKWSAIKKDKRYSWDLANDDELSTLALCFADSALWPSDIKEKLITDKKVNTAGNLFRILTQDNKVFLEPSYWGDDDPDEDAPNTCQIIIPRDVLLKIIDEGVRWMKKDVPRVVFMHYKDHYFIADRVLIEDELNAILQNSDRKEVIAIKDH